MKENYKIALIFIIGILLGGCIGMGVGAMAMLNFVVEKGVQFINMSGANITIDTSQLVEGIWRYQHTIG